MTGQWGDEDFRRTLHQTHIRQLTILTDGVSTWDVECWSKSRAIEHEILRSNRGREFTKRAKTNYSIAASLRSKPTPQPDMKFTSFIVLAIASVASATTIPTTGKPPGDIILRISAKCNAFACVGAYAGEIAACGAAAAELGANPLADIACFAALLGAESVACQ
ncbi:hypothetical protein EXIGLDRAFT_693216 [Exidia glandulosa HHB12029]|uniref:Fungal calcium binding protein domain-containing protein n=1 Tax=Exidia glandulosa HHB12029 TaxID=1314781 RepID=A0A165HFD9_EXIGL|nr:hypothetical protein EXIGLDRAFT_693216 [Exidia glandulosa HHB12029]